VQAAEHDLRAALAIEARELVRALREREVYRDADHLGGIGSIGGGPWRRFSYQYRSDHPSGVAPAMLVSASVGVSTCLPKLACGSFA
jgi:hypothetical protein